MLKICIFNFSTLCGYAYLHTYLEMKIRYVASDVKGDQPAFLCTFRHAELK